MNPGSLNRRITIQKQTSARNAEGVASKEWEPVTTVWAGIEYLRGREYFQAASINSEVTARIRIRYRQGLTAHMRVVYGERIFEIINVFDIEEKHREIHLMCKEVS